jgi:hypothetical protein
MGDRKAALFVTDPPYLVDYTGADRPGDSGKDWSASYREVDIRDAEAFLLAAFSNGAAVCRPDAAWYCWHAHKRAALVEAIWARLGVLNHQQIVWVKPNAVHTYSFWPWRHEPCLMGWKQGHKPSHDRDNSHAFTSVWECDWEGRVGPSTMPIPPKSRPSCSGVPCASTPGPATFVSNRSRAVARSSSPPNRPAGCASP